MFPPSLHWCVAGCGSSRNAPLSGLSQVGSRFAAVPVGLGSGGAERTGEVSLAHPWMKSHFCPVGLRASESRVLSVQQPSGCRGVGGAVDEEGIIMLMRVLHYDERTCDIWRWLGRTWCFSIHPQESIKKMLFGFSVGGNLKPF